METFNQLQCDLGSENNWLHVIPFLPSERIRRVEKTLNGNICLTNFRLLFYSKNQMHTISIPIYLIWRVNLSIVHLNLITKIGTTLMCLFKNVMVAESWVALIASVIDCPNDTSGIFAFSYRKAVEHSNNVHPYLLPIMQCLQLDNKDTGIEAALVLHEFERMKFSKDWKVTDVNNNFKICSSYPKYHIMPRNIKDIDIPSMAAFRSHNRFPSVVWRSQKTGAVLLRCAQPCVGLMYSRNELDELFVRAVLSNCRIDSSMKQKLEDLPGLLIVDARNYHVAQLNRIRGGGFEYVEYYEQSQIRFMDLPNIHSVRVSFERLIQLYVNKSDNNWYSSLEKTLWLYYISQLLKSASEVASALDVHARPVMIHCTDGWDRTPQLTSLSQILLDPYYRTIQGFRILIEREWLQFGHKFGDRCGHGVHANSSEERSPIFLQWLDCVRQLHHQFPSYFEFNELFLIKLALHTYSGLFGTFLCNSERERQTVHCSTETCSVWAFLNPTNNWTICNYLYEPNSRVIEPAWEICNLNVWDSLYQNALLPCTLLDPLKNDGTTTNKVKTDEQLISSTISSGSKSGQLENPMPPITSSLEVSPTVTAQSDDDLLTKKLVYSDHNLNKSHSLSNIPVQRTLFNELKKSASFSLLTTTNTLYGIYHAHKNSFHSTSTELYQSNDDSPHKTDFRNYLQSKSDICLYRSMKNISNHPNYRLSVDNFFPKTNELIETIITDQAGKTDFIESKLATETRFQNPLILNRSRSNQDVLISCVYENRRSSDPPSAACCQQTKQLPYDVTYFTQPVFSQSYLNLTNPNSTDAHLSITSSKSQTPAHFNMRLHAESDILHCLSPSQTGDNSAAFHLESIPHNKISRLKSTACSTFQPLHLTNSLRFGSPPDNLNLFMHQGSQFNDKESTLISSIWPSDWDGLPLRVDSVTARLHRRYEQEADERLRQQAQIDKLTKQSDLDKMELASLKKDMNQLRCMLRFQSNKFNLSDSLESVSFRVISEEDNLTSEELQTQKAPVSVEEALSDAMCIPNYLNNPLEDEHLVEQTDCCSVPPICPRYLPRITSRDAVRSCSFSSDVSSFEVVDAKDALVGLVWSSNNVEGSQNITGLSTICKGCSIPFSSLKPSHPCSNCNQAVCRACGEFDHYTNNLQSNRQKQICFQCSYQLNFQLNSNPDIKTISNCDCQESTIGLLAEVQDEFPIQSTSSPSTGSIIIDNIPCKSSTPTDSPLGKKLNGYRCRTIENRSSTTGGRNQNTFAKA